MTTFTRNRQRVTDTSGVLLFLEMDDPAFSGPVQIVADNKDWVSNGVTYLGIQFGFKLPDDNSGQSPRTQLVMGNVGRGITEELEKLGPGATIMATLKLADRSDPDTITRTYVLPMTNVSASGATVSAQLGVDHIMRQQAVRIRANAQTVGRP